MKFAYSLACGVVMAVVSLAGARTAEAASRDCPNGYVCVWEHVDFKGRMLKFKDSGWANLGGALGFNDKVSSWCNKMGVDAQLSFHTNGGGRKTCLQNNTCSSRVSGDWNDEASSLFISRSRNYCR